MDYVVVDVLDAIDHVKPMLEAHWNEIAHFKDKIDLEPDWDFYRACSENIHCVVAFDGGDVVGYFVCFIKSHPHYKGSVWAQNDVLYLKPEYRKTGAGKGMFEYAEKTLKEKGVDVLLVNMKVDNPFDGLVETLGYNPYERIYAKFIGD